ASCRRPICGLPQRTKTSVVLISLWRPVHGNASGQAVREDVVGGQGDEDVIVMRIDGHRMRGPAGGRRAGRRVERRHYLHEVLALGVDDAEDRPRRIRAGGRVIAPVAGVEPDLVRAAYTGNLRIDLARLRVHDDLLRGGSVYIRRGPRTAQRVEDHAAAEKEVLLGPEREAGRLAEI